MDYKKESIYIGSSDAAFLTVVGCTTDGVKAEILQFGGDGSYNAYIVRNFRDIPAHYHLVMEFETFKQFYNMDGTRGEVCLLDSWVKIYDDTSMTASLRGKRIRVYRAGDYGALINIED